MNVHHKVLMARASAIITTLLLCSSIALTQDKLSPLDPLGKFVGTWDKKFTIFRSEWIAEQSEMSGTHTVEWILDNKHLRETGNDSDGGTYLSVYSWDQEANELSLSGFQSTGAAWRMKGSWDAQTNTMTWSRSVNDDIEMKATYRLLNENEFVFSYKASDKNGKNYFRLEGTGTRSGRNK